MKRQPDNYEGLPDEHKKFRENHFRRHGTIEGTKEYQIVQEAVAIQVIHEISYDKWKDGELEGNAFITKLQDDIERLEKNIKVFEGEEIGIGTGSFGFRYPHKVIPFKELMRKIICRLQEMMDGLNQENIYPPKRKSKNMKIKMMLPRKQQKTVQKHLNELFDGVSTDEEFEKRMDRFEDMYTPKYEIYRKCENELSDVLDQYIAGTLPKNRALLLLRSKYDRISGEVIEINKRGGFIIIDDVPDEFIKITMAIYKYYNEMKSYLECLDVESQKQEAPTSSQNSESSVAEPDTAINLPLNDVLEKLVVQHEELLRRWNNGKFKCNNLREFVNIYADTTGKNPTKNLILDYLVKENGESFKESGIVSTLNSYGVSPERKKTKGRRRKGTHKKDSL